MSKTLFERLSKENQEKINNYGFKYSKQTVLSALEKQYFGSLTAKEVVLICDALGVPENLNELRQLFNN